MKLPWLISTLFALRRPEIPRSSLTDALKQNPSYLNDVRRPSPPTAPTVFTVSVCQSPGCVGDGAAETLERLQALAPPDVIVETGSCSSHCGKGPIVSICSSCPVAKSSNAKPLILKKVKATQALARVAEASDQVQAPPKALVQGFEMTLKADKIFQQKQYAAAFEQYEQAVQTAYSAAISWQTIREAASPRNSKVGALSLAWLVRARRNQACCQLELGDVQAAEFAAQAACNLSKNTCAASFGVLSRVYMAKGDTAAELDALRLLFAVPVPDENSLSFAEKNGRRELSFRRDKLEREQAAKAPPRRRRRYR